MFHGEIFKINKIKNQYALNNNIDLIRILYIVTTQLRDASKSENEWIIDKDIPILKGKDRKYIDNLIYVGE